MEKEQEHQLCFQGTRRAPWTLVAEEQGNAGKCRVRGFFIYCLSNQGSQQPVMQNRAGGAAKPPRGHLLLLTQGRLVPHRPCMEAQAPRRPGGDAGMSALNHAVA